MFYESDRIKVPENAISSHFTSASGPGGQHINHSSTAVQLRVDLALCTIDPIALLRLKKLAGRRITDSNILLLRAQNNRSQRQNRAEALSRAQQLFEQAETLPKKRRPMKPSRKMILKRLEEKKRRSDTKSSRKSVEY